MTPAKTKAPARKDARKTPMKLDNKGLTAARKNLKDGDRKSVV